MRSEKELGAGTRATGRSPDTSLPRRSDCDASFHMRALKKRRAIFQCFSVFHSMALILQQSVSLHQQHRIQHAEPGSYTSLITILSFRPDQPSNLLFSYHLAFAEQ